MNASIRIATRMEAGFVLAQEARQQMVRSTAKLSSCRKYRYTLIRRWRSFKPTVMFVGLNPSTADATLDDPTVRRCISFAKAWGFGGMILTNLFAFRSTDPDRLEEVEDPIGPRNNQWIVRSAQYAQKVVVAWGTHGGLLERDDEVLSLLSKPFCLGFTKNGAPRHPLYLPSNTLLTRFRR